MEIFDQPYFLHEMLNGTAIEQNQTELALKEKKYAHLLQVTEEALQAILYGDLRKFDPLVGTTCCQAHTLMFLELFQDPKLLDEATEILECVRYARSCVGHLEKLNGKESIVNLLTRHGFIIQTSKRIQTFILGYLLTLCKQGHDKTDKTALATRGFTGVHGIVDEAKVAFSQIAIDYLKKKAEAFNVDLSKIRMDTKKVKCIQFFPLTDAVMRAACKDKIPIILNVKHPDGIVSLCYASNGETYELCSRENLPTNVFRIDAEASKTENETLDEYKKRLMNYNILELVYMCAALHRQFADSFGGEKDLEENALMLKYRDEGKKLGCDDSNTALCNIKHVYPDKKDNAF